MRNALLLLSVWVGIILTAYVVVYWDGSSDWSSPFALVRAATRTAYLDPQGRYLAVVPPRWRVEAVEPALHLVDRDETINVWIATVEERDPERAILEAWETVDPGFVGAPEEILEEPPYGPVARVVRVTYAGEDAAQVLYGLAQVAEGMTVVLLVRGDRTAVERWSRDLEQIELELQVLPPATAPSDETLPAVEL